MDQKHHHKIWQIYLYNTKTQTKCHRQDINFSAKQNQHKIQNRQKKIEENLLTTNLMSMKEFNLNQ